ncbi:hypothetical protein L249_3769 [Ophiocordyceps polyrhachis-furcata BCC 54312]|uniref:Uncharacterized protein n=1 Tax=Ophiocordyceps polyrhachis-furcata BCC 54312 TaxID=1330021 RepID=A0A367L4S9_9HYPO|nr:hypothetical protein L249_3769 [Ophiocordyceps polyrhachis-furcata BCC 54312]
MIKDTTIKQGRRGPLTHSNPHHPICHRPILQPLAVSRHSIAFGQPNKELFVHRPPPIPGPHQSPPKSGPASARSLASSSSSSSSSSPSSSLD